MGKGLILDTTVLIDLEREMASGRSGPAIELLERFADDRLMITPVVAGELAEGWGLARRSAWEEFLAPFQVLPHTSEVTWRYGTTARYLRANGLSIGANDTWIAAVALAYSLPLATGNAQHFRRVPGLELATYGS